MACNKRQPGRPGVGVWHERLPMDRCIMKAEIGGGTWGMAADGAQEVRVHMMGAETWGMATDGVRDRAETGGAQRGGMWAHTRGVDAGETCGTAMCTLRGPGWAWHMCKGHDKGGGPAHTVNLMDGNIAGTGHLNGFQQLLA